MSASPPTPLSLSIRLSYGVGSLGTGMFAAVPGLLLLYFMTDTLGIAPGLAGLGVFLPKIWDVITDPVMGSLSDRTRHSWGRRRPYLLVGAVALPVFFALLFAVPSFDSPGTSFLYVVVAFILAATGFTLFQVPYIAMPAEMTPDYKERTTVMGFRMVFMTLGILVAGGAAPLIIDMAGGGRGGYAVMSFSLAGVCLVAMLLSFLGTAKAPFQKRVETTLPFKEQIRIAFKNRPFILLVCGFFPQQIGVGCTLAMLPFYVNQILGGSQTQLTFMFLCLMLPAIFFMPLWVLLSRKLGKLGSYLLSSLMFGLTVASMYLTAGQSPGLLYLQMTIVGTAYAGIQLFPFSMLPDTIEVDAANSGLRREGIFTGAWTAQEKTGMALGALLAGTVLDWSGFIETTAGQSAAQPSSALTGILIGFALIPAALFLLSLPIIRRYDLSEERLKALQAGAGAGAGAGRP